MSTISSKHKINIGNVRAKAVTLTPLIVGKCKDGCLDP
jgi:hypothetical protein